jgi:hypothetical protein
MKHSFLIFVQPGIAKSGHNSSCKTSFLSLITKTGFFSLTWGYPVLNNTY